MTATGGAGGGPGAAGGSAARWAPGLRGDVQRLFSPAGTHEGRPSLARAAERILTRPGPLAIVLYRAGHRLWRRGHTALAELLWRANVFLTGADIHPGAEIGGGLRMVHSSGVVIGRDVRIGSNVLLLHDVTIGGSGRASIAEGFVDGNPVVGDDCEIFAGAKILGPITVGRGCHVGANAVVAHDLPDGTVYTPGRQLRAALERVEYLEAEVAALQARLAQLEAASEKSDSNGGRDG